MNNTVILTQLSATIAGLTRCSEADAENFLRELFQLAAERLEADGQVTVPGLGTFMITDETVAFAPDSELAEAINAPFAAFEAVELPDDLEAEEAADEVAEAESAEFEQEEDADERADEPEPQFTDDEPATQPCRDARPVRPPQPENEPQSADESTPDTDAQTVRPYTEEPVTPDRRRGSVWPVIWWSLACVASFALGWFARGYEPVGIPKYIAETVPEPVEVVEAEDTVVAVEEPVEVVEVAKPVAEPVAKPVAEPVTDTIRAGRFLTTMAREHYGRMEYWVYIYEANAAKLGHPDRLSAGTVVVIPSADSLGLRPDDSAKIAEAERLAAEIYGRFN